MISIKLIYAANVLVAGWVGLSCLFTPRKALTTVFTSAYEYSEVIRLVGALWTGIAILSAIGLFYPQQMSLVLVFQLLYKLSWLLVVAIPAKFQKRKIPVAVAVFFIVWVIVLPFVIPWTSIFG